MFIVPTTRSALPTLRTLNVWGELDELTLILAKFFAAGLTEISGSGASPTLRLRMVISPDLNG